MVAKNFINSPPAFNLPLSLGQDLYVKVVYKTVLRDEENEPILDSNGKKQYVITDYPEDAEVNLEIDTEEKIVVSATISGSVATVWEDFVVVDAVPAKKFWRVKITYGDTLVATTFLF